MTEVTIETVEVQVRHFPKATWRALRVAAAVKDISTRQILVEAAEQWLARQANGQPVEAR